MPIIIVVSILLLFGAVAWRDLKLALLLLIGLLPVYLLRFTVVVPWTLLEGMILVAFVAWVSKRRPAGRLYSDVREAFGPYARPACFLLIVATLAILWAPDHMSALGVWKAYFIEPALVFVMLRTTFVSRNDWIKALMALSLTTCAIAIFAIFQKLTGLGLPIPWDVERRATSFFDYPNAVGLFVAPVVAALCTMAVAQWRADGRPPVRTAAFAMGAVLGVVAIVLAKTEAALVAIPAALVVVFALSAHGTKARPSRALTRKAFMIVLATTVGAVLVASVPAIRDKVLLQDYSGNVRRSQWTETIELIKDRPIQGAGLSGYPSVFKPYHDATLYEIFQYPHNLILNFWVELGIFGVVAWLWIALATGKIMWQRRDDPLVLAAFAALLTMTIHGLVDVPFFKNDLAVLTVVFLGMMLAPNPLTVDR